MLDKNFKFDPADPWADDSDMDRSPAPQPSDPFEPPPDPSEEMRAYLRRVQEERLRQIRLEALRQNADPRVEGERVVGLRKDAYPHGYRKRTAG